MENDKLTEEEQKLLDADAAAGDDTAAGEESGDGKTAGDDTAAGEHKEAKDDRVPLPELIRERKARQAAEQREQRLTGRLEVLEKLAKGEEEQKPTTPLDRLAMLERQSQERAAADRDNARVNHLVTSYRAAAQDFARTSPDFEDAYRHLMTERDAELQDAGYGDPQMRAQIIAAEEMAIVGRAFQDGVNPASRLYALAKRRGYKAGGNSNAAEKIETVNRGVAASRSLSNAAGSAPRGKSLESIANMSDEEFAEATSGKKWKQLFAP